MDPWLSSMISRSTASGWTLCVIGMGGVIVLLKILADQIALACFAKLATDLGESRYCEVDPIIVDHMFRTVAPICAVLDQSRVFRR